MTDKEKLSCVDCGTSVCGTKDEAKYPPFCMTKRLSDELIAEVTDLYLHDEETNRISYESALIENEFYGKYTRVEETVEFMTRMGYKKIGIATCGGLLDEARTYARILRAHDFEVVTVCCKIAAFDKSLVGVPAERKMNGGCGHESMCNPVMQAKVLAENKCDFVVVIGLCVGHDTLFFKYNTIPATVLVAKDRVLCHNPAAALYQAKTGYSRFKKELG